MLQLAEVEEGGLEPGAGHVDQSYGDEVICYAMRVFRLEMEDMNGVK